MRPRNRMYTTLAALVLAALPATAQAQSAGTLSGRIVDASSGEGVADVVVTLEPVTAGLIPAGDPAALVSARTVGSGASGHYRFTDVIVGTYRIRIERLGSHPATLEAEVQRPVEAGAS